MSWSFGFVTTGTLAAFDDALASGKETYTTQQEGYGNPVSEETSSQINATGTAAREIMKAHCVGGTDKTYNVVLSGHANPDHEPVAGMANDQVNVSISQVS